MTADAWAAADYRVDVDPPDDYQPDPEELEAREDLDHQAQLDMRVARRVDELRVNELARARLAAEKAGAAAPFDAGTLAEILDRGPAPDPRVEDLIPTEAGTLVVAKRKTGKTTFQLNLAKSLLSGSDFLGRFGVRKLDGNVALLNFEVSSHTVARWAHDHQVPDDRLFIVNLRGARNPFSHPDEQLRLATLLRQHDVETLIVDPFGRAFTGENQNDPGQVGAWLSQLDHFGRSPDGASCADIILATHAGWVGERTRGSSALEDWADSIITLTRDTNDDQKRFLKAEGRDVLIDEDQLAYDPTTRTLTLTGTGSRRVVAKTEQIHAQVPIVRDILTKSTVELNGSNIDVELKDRLTNTNLAHSNGDGAKAAKILEDLGEVTSRKAGRATLFAYSPDSPTSPQGNRSSSPHPLSRGELEQELQDQLGAREIPDTKEEA